MSATRLSAEVLRHTLAIGFQPSIVSQPDLLSTSITRMARQFTVANVSEARLRAAADDVALDDELLERLIAELR